VDYGPHWKCGSGKPVAVSNPLSGTFAPVVGAVSAERPLRTGHALAGVWLAGPLPGLIAGALMRLADHRAGSRYTAPCLLGGN